MAVNIVSTAPQATLATPINAGSPIGAIRPEVQIATPAPSGSINPYYWESIGTEYGTAPTRTATGATVPSEVQQFRGRPASASQGATSWQPTPVDWRNQPARPSGLRRLNPAASVNPSPASPNATGRPLGGPVGAPPTARTPTTAPRPVAGGGGRGGAVGFYGIPIGDWLGRQFADWAAPDRAAFANLPPGAIGPLPADSLPTGGAISGRGGGVGPGASGTFPWGAGAAAAGAGGAAEATRRGWGGAGRNFAPASTLPAIPKPSWMPDWAWPYPQPPIPNELPPDALGQGPRTSEGAPGTVAAGTVAGAAYQVHVYGGISDGVPTPESFYNLLGPLNIVGPTIAYPFGRYEKFITIEGSEGGGAFKIVLEDDYISGNPRIRNVQYAIYRTDGGQDPVVGTVPPTYAPNPARRPASSPRPRNLPPPITTPQPGLQPTGATNPNGTPQYAPGPHPWPGSDPAYRPEPPIALTPEPPPNFQPSDLGDPASAFDPAKDIASQPDLDNPSKTAPAIDGNPGTPPVNEPFDYTLDNGTRVRRLPDGSTEISTPLDSGIQITGIPGINTGVLPQVPQVPLIVPLPMRQTATTPRNPLQPFPPQQPQNPNQPDTNPNVDNRPRPRPPTTPNPNPRALCQYERARVMDIQNKSTNTNQRASNPTSGFPGLYGLQIESRIKQGQIFDLVTSTKAFMQKAWEMTRIQKVLDVLTFIGVMHNVSMLSRDVGETFFQLITSSFQAVGIRDEEGGVIDVQEVVGDATESFLRRILTDQVYDGLNEAWNKANRIISSASAVIWSIRSMSDASLDLLEWVGEHTGRIGNALKRWGVVGERAYPWMSEKPRAFPKGRRWLDRASQTLETVEDHISVFQQAASSVIEVQEEIQETGENIDRFTASILDAVPDPWADNNPILSRFADDKAASVAPDIAPADAQQGS